MHAKDILSGPGLCTGFTACLMPKMPSCPAVQDDLPGQPTISNVMKTTVGSLPPSAPCAQQRLSGTRPFTWSRRQQSTYQQPVMWLCSRIGILVGMSR